MTSPGDNQVELVEAVPARVWPKCAHRPHWDLTNVIIGSAYDVHSVLGAGFLESVYANALAVELRRRGLHVERNVVFEVWYRGVLVGRYKADHVVERTVIVETKAAKGIEQAHRTQLLNYLSASGLEVGLVINFGSSVQFRRVISSRPRPSLEGQIETTTPNAD